MPKVAQTTRLEFGKAVKRARGLKGWQLKDLANAMPGNSSVSFLSDIEKGKRSISVATVGRIVGALDLDESWVDRWIGEDPQATDEVTAQDRVAAQLIATSEKEGDSGVAEGLMIALAYEYAEGDTTDLDSAYRGLKAALETARDMAQRAALPDNTDAAMSAMSAIRAEVQALNEAEQMDAADARIAQALARKQAEVSALLDLGLQQARIRNDPKAAATRVWEKLRLDGAPDLFGALLEETYRWIHAGRDKGLRFDSLVAIHLAQELVAQAKTQDEKGKAHGTAGIALHTLGKRESGAKRLERAILAYEVALTEFTRERVPLGWAATQMNLGNALQTLGQRESGTDHLEQAVVAFEAALEEWTREQVPLDWAMAQMNLGNALQTLGERESGTDRLEQAVAAFEAALEEWTREQVPLDWARTQINLGNALQTLGERESGTDRLELADVAYQTALEEWTRGRVPLDWALVQANLAHLEYAFFEKTGDVTHLETGLQHAQLARDVFVAAQASQYVDMIERDIARHESAKGAPSR